MTWKRDDIALIVCRPETDAAKVSGRTCRLISRYTSGCWFASPDKPVWRVHVAGIGDCVQVAEYCLRKADDGDASWDQIEKICKWRPDRVVA